MNPRATDGPRIAPVGARRVRAARVAAYVDKRREAPTRGASHKKRTTVGHYIDGRKANLPRVVLTIRAFSPLVFISRKKQAYSVAAGVRPLGLLQ